MTGNAVGPRRRWEPARRGSRHAPSAIRTFTAACRDLRRAAPDPPRRLAAATAVVELDVTSVAGEELFTATVVLRDRNGRSRRVARRGYVEGMRAALADLPREVTTALGGPAPAVETGIAAVKVAVA